MPIINFKAGQERDIVLETRDFDNSIFKDQYRRAIKILGDNVKDLDNSAPKVITFCGDRGDGKTSCLCSVLEILRGTSPRHGKGCHEKYDKDRLKNTEKFIEKYGDRILLDKKYLITELVDPSFFDTSHNVLDIVIGRMYNKFLHATDEDCDYEFQEKVIESFQEVKKRLSCLSKGLTSGRNDISTLNDLAASIELKESLAKLVKRYLRYMKRDVLIIPVDDIDLALLEAYEMCEQIRKYLCVPGCIVMMCVKVPQLQEVISTAFQRDMKANYLLVQQDLENPVMNEWDLKAKKYIDKLLPVSSRIDMPKPYSLEDIKIKLDSDNDDKAKNLSTGLLEMIFIRTRYLFYNPAGGISPIIPNNLRELFNLVGLLASMKPVEDSRGSEEEKETLKANKRLFKNYFFTVWKDRFDAATQETLDNLLNYDYGTSFNREVVKILTSHFNDRLKKDYDYTPEDEEQESSDKTKGPTVKSKASKGTSSNQSETNDKPHTAELYSSITAPEDFGYNVTIGDVFYLFSMLEKETLSEGGYALVFFLKSYYSILLYEAYEHITENNKEIYPDILPENKGLTVIDSRFDHTNKLQQLIGGSYFTFAPGELLPKGWDIRVVNGIEFNKLLANVKALFEAHEEIIHKPSDQRNAEEKQKIEELTQKLNIVELFILQTKCAVRMKHDSDREKTVPQHLTSLRKNVEAFHYRSFFPSTGYFMLDVTAPFANIVNPEFSYKRFTVIDDRFYKKILEYPGSLLYKMIGESSPYREHIAYADDKERERYHRLLSVGVIRNAEVLTAVKENIVKQRKSSQENARTELQNFYRKIKESEMATHTTGDGPYKIVYHFLTPIQILMTELAKDNWKNEGAAIFNDVFQLDRKEPQQGQNPQELKNQLLEEIKYKQKHHSVTKAILSLPEFANLNKEDLQGFMERTLLGFAKAEKQKWIEENISILLEAKEDPNKLKPKEPEQPENPDENVVEGEGQPVEADQIQEEVENQDGDEEVPQEGNQGGIAEPVAEEAQPQAPENQ